jgi:tRNA A58 N-methylase Trm61
MKKLEKNKLKALLEIIGSNPSLQIAHFTQGGEMLTNMLSEYCHTRDYLYQINSIDNAFYDTSRDKFKTIDTTLVKNFNLNRKSYMMQGKQYDFIFITVDIEDNFKEEFLKQIHKIVLNAGNIVIFLPKGDTDQRYKWIALLEETYYVATNTIDDLFENYDIIISKKMHGWGGK